MNQSVSIIFLLLLLTSVIPFTGQAQVAPEKLNPSMLEESMKAVTGSKQVNWKVLFLSANLKKEIRPKLKLKKNLPDTLYLGTIRTDDAEYRLIPDIAPSKSEYYSFILYVDNNDAIKDVDVLEYRENYGYEIDYDYFRQQFRGKKESAEIRFRRSIQNISGATISARSLTYAVHDLMLILNQLGD